jgi:hypothetical protein
MANTFLESVPLDHQRQKEGHRGLVVQNGQRGRVAAAQPGIGRVGKGQVDGLVPLLAVVVQGSDGEGLESVTGVEG